MVKTVLCMLIAFAFLAGEVNAISVTATATPSTVTGMKTTLKATVTNPGGLVAFTWSVTSAPAGAEVGLYPPYNGSELAQTLTALFPKAGTYKFKIFVRNIQGQTAEASVTVTVNLTASKIAVYPPAATSNFKGSKTYTAVEFDQFGAKMTTQPTFDWSVSPTSNVTISNGKVTSTQTAVGNFVVTANDHAKPAVTGTATFSVVDSARMIADARAKIKHIIIIMQENRSFDHFFGKFKPGNNQRIDTIPADAWCVYNNNTYMPGDMESPTKKDGNYGHEGKHAKAIIGDTARPWPPTQMNLSPSKYCTASNATTAGAEEILAHHPESHIPAYHQLAKNFVLQDRMFAPCPSFSKPTHMYLYSGWSVYKPSTTYKTWIGDEGDAGELNRDFPYTAEYPWNSIGGLLQSSSCNYTSWAIYQGVGWYKADFMCGSFDMTDYSESNMTRYWALLKNFSDVKTYYGYHNVFEFIYNIALYGEGSIPQVSWIIPDGDVSDHPNWSGVNNGHAYVVSILDRIMNDAGLWNSCAVFLSWDDWGGYYDHAVPPKTTDKFGYGIRVPGLLISPYAKKNTVDQQTLSFDAYLRFIEDIFCNCTRIPFENSSNNMGNVKRPEQRENDPKLGNLLYEFDFNQTPLPPITNLPCGY